MGCFFAQDLSYHKKGAFKYSNSQLIFFWDAASGLIASGFTSDTLFKFGMSYV